MKRLKRLCKFLSGMCSGSAGSCFVLAAIGHNARLAIVGLIMFLISIVITITVAKAEEEEKKNIEDLN